LLRDAKPLAAAENSRRDAVASQAIEAQPTFGQIRPSEAA
jgi:hypothetical protein